MRRQKVNDNKSSEMNRNISDNKNDEASKNLKFSKNKTNIRIRQNVIVSVAKFPNKNTASFMVSLNCFSRISSLS